MPTPERTTLEAIVAAGRDILESDGPAGLTMQAVAQRVGVRAPSLYKRVRDRDALLSLVAAASIAELTERLDAAAGALEPLGRAFRAFARARPEGFRLIFSDGGDQAALQRAVAPILAVTEQLVGPQRALDAARLVTAWASGFITMELAGAFRMGGDVDGAFEYGLDTLERALRAG
jgi:AcrR family transcriptional regulator